MIIGAHVLLYSRNADADRAFLRDVLQFRSIDIGHGWMIFELPPAEAAVHPADPATEPSGDRGLVESQIYLMCDDLRATLERLGEQGVAASPIVEERWGIRTTIGLPSGSSIGMYQPSHPTALALGPRADAR